MEQPAELPALLKPVLASIRRHAARQLLLDLRALPPLNQNMEQWLRVAWLPRLRAVGLRRLALLLPADRHNLRVIEGLLWASAEQSLPYEMQYFSGLAAALDWLSDAELPSAERDWRRQWQAPALLRARHRRWPRRAS